MCDCVSVQIHGQGAVFAKSRDRERIREMEIDRGNQRISMKIDLEVLNSVDLIKQQV